MNPLLRKDRPWLLGLGLLGLVCAVGAVLAEGGTWSLPEQRYIQVVLAFYLVAGSLLGLVGALIDDLLRTRDYVLHRSTSPARMFWTRHGAGLAVVALWVVLAPALALVINLAIRNDRFLLQPGRYFHVVDESTAGLVFFAVGVFAGTLVRRLIFALPLAALLDVAVASLLFLPRLARERPLFDGVPLVLVAVPVAALFLVLAQRCERDGRDADLPWSPRRLREAGALLLVLLVPAASMALTGLERGAREMVYELYPRVGREKLPRPPGETGPAALGRPVLYVEGLWGRHIYETDAEHRKGEARPRGSVQNLWGPERIRKPPFEATIGQLSKFGHRFEGRLVSEVSCPGFLHCYLSSDGYVEFVREAPPLGQGDEGGEPMRMRTGRGAGDEPFGPEFRAAGIWWRGTGYLLDPHAGELWAANLSASEPRFARVTLPDGDRPRWDFTYDVWWGDPERRMGLPPPVVVQGERGFYTADEAGGLIPAPPELAARVSRYARLRAVKAEVTRTGPLSASAAIDVGDGMTVRHDYQPRTALERAMAIGFYASAAARPTVLLAASYAAPEDDPSSSYATIGFVLERHQRALTAKLALANLALALVLAGASYRRLSRFGLPRARVLGWTVAAFAGGLPAYLTMRFIETRRAWLAAASVPETAASPATSLLIQPA